MVSKDTHGLGVACCRSNSNSLENSADTQLVRRRVPFWSQLLFALLRFKIPRILPVILLYGLFIGFTVLNIREVVVQRKDKKYWSMCAPCVIPQVFGFCIYIASYLVPQRCSCSFLKWFNTGVFIFLLCVLPPMWIHEVHYLDIIRYRHWYEESKWAYRMHVENLLHKNTWMWHGKEGECRNCSNHMMFRFTYFGSDKVPFYFCTQLCMFLAIFGHCLLSPWGFNSDMLIVQICKGADIIELLQYLEDKSVESHPKLKIGLLCLWHITLLQFCFNSASGDVFSSSFIHKHWQTSGSNCHNFLPRSDTNPFCWIPGSKTKEMSQSNSQADLEAEPASNASVKASWACCRCCSLTALLGEILVSVLLQDLPFLILRLTLYFEFKMHSLQVVCFTIKNVLFLMVHGVQALTLLSRVW